MKGMCKVQCRQGRTWFTILGLILVVFWSLPLCTVLADEPTEAEESEESEQAVEEQSVEGQAVHRLDATVVTATRTERPLESVPASVTVITREDIEQSTALSADELLQDAAGVWSEHNRGINTSGTNNAVSMRGLPTEGRVLVLLDGIPINECRTQAVEWNEFPLENIERIEVVRGPASALYGGNAMGGVINIITRKPTKEFMASLEGGYGSLDTWEVNAQFGGMEGNFGYFLTGKRLESEGYCDMAPERKNEYTSEKGDVVRDNYTAKLYYDFSPDTSVTVSGSYHRNDRSGIYNLIPNYNLFQEDINRGDLIFKTRLGEVDLQASVYGSHYNTSYDQYGSGYDWINYTNEAFFWDVGGILQANFGLGQYNYFTLGADFRTQNMNSEYNYHRDPDYGRNAGGRQNIWSVFGQDEISLLDDTLILTLGARYDWWYSYDGYSLDTHTYADTQHFDNTLDGAFSPKFGVVYHVTDYLSFRGGVGEAFRAPDLNKLFRGDRVSGSTLQKGNTDLGPEELISYEIGLDVNYEDLMFRATYYYTEAEDFIQYITVDPADDPENYAIYNSVKQYENIGEVEIQGVELEASYQLFKDLSLWGNYTMNWSEVIKYEADTALEGKELAGFPKTKGSFGLIYDNPDILTARLTGRYVGTVYDDDLNSKEYGNYLTADARISRKICDFVEASLEVVNLSDGKYQIDPYFVVPGRTFMGTLRFSL